jgi:hypothetical protein
MRLAQNVLVLFVFIAAVTGCSDAQKSTFGEIRGLTPQRSVYTSVVIAPDSLEAAVAEMICPPFRDSVAELEANVRNQRLQVAEQIHKAMVQRGVEKCIDEIFSGRRTGACDRKIGDPKAYMDDPRVQATGAQRLEDGHARFRQLRNSSLIAAIISADTIGFEVSADGRFEMPVPDSGSTAYAVIVSPAEELIARLPKFTAGDTTVVAFDKASFGLTHEICKLHTDIPSTALLSSLTRQLKT